MTFSLRFLVGVMAYVTLASRAVARPTGNAIGILSGITLLIVASALLAAILRWQPFWIGFALFGWLCLAIHIGPLSSIGDSGSASILHRNIARKLHSAWPNMMNRRAANL